MWEWAAVCMSVLSLQVQAERISQISYWHKTFWTCKFNKETKYLMYCLTISSNIPFVWVSFLNIILRIIEVLLLNLPFPFVLTSCRFLMIYVYTIFYFDWNIYKLFKMFCYSNFCCVWLSSSLKPLRMILCFRTVSYELTTCLHRV